MASFLGAKREPEFVFDSDIAMAKLAAAVGDAHVPAPCVVGTRPRKSWEMLARSFPFLKVVWGHDVGSCY